MRNPIGIRNKGNSFDKAASVSFGSIVQKYEIAIKKYRRTGKTNACWSLKFCFLKVITATNKKITSDMLFIAKLNGIVESTNSIGIKELFSLFSFTRF